MNVKMPHARTISRPIVHEDAPQSDPEDTERQDRAPDDHDPESGLASGGPEEPKGPGPDDGVAVARRPRRDRRRNRFPNHVKQALKIPATVWANPPSPEPVAEPARPRSVTRLALRIVTAVVLIAMVVLSVVLWRQNTSLSDDARQRRSLNSSADKVASTFFNWDYQHMDQSFAAKYPLLTKAAADAIRPTAATLTSYFTTNKVSSAASITGIYTGKVKEDEANVMVIINTKVTTGKAVQSNIGATVAISMKRVSGSWLAGNITLLSPGVESTTDQNGKPLTTGKDSPAASAVPSTAPSGP